MTKIYQLLRLCNHESWLGRIFSPLQPWLMLAKRLTSWICSIKFLFLVKISKMWFPKCHIHRKSYEISLFATVSHRCKEKTVLCNHDSWLPRIFLPSPPWLTVAKRLMLWEFSIIFMKISWLLKTCIYLWFWQKKKS